MPSYLAILQSGVSPPVSGLLAGLGSWQAGLLDVYTSTLLPIYLSYKKVPLLLTLVDLNPIHLMQLLHQSTLHCLCPFRFFRFLLLLPNL